MLSQLCWITVNCYGIVPPFMEAITEAAFFGGLGLAMFLMHSLGDLRFKSVELIRKNRKRYLNGKVSVCCEYVRRM